MRKAVKRNNFVVYLESKRDLLSVAALVMLFHKQGLRKTIDGTFEMVFLAHLSYAQNEL